MAAKIYTGFISLCFKGMIQRHDCDFYNENLHLNMEQNMKDISDTANSGSCHPSLQGEGRQIQM